MTTVLIVETDDATRELYQRELGRTYDVLTSADAAQSLELFQNEAIDALVLEPAVSDGEGWRLMDALQHMPVERSVRIVLCSALDERRRGMRLGAAAYLVKPVLPVTLLDTLRQVLQSQ